MSLPTILVLVALIAFPLGYTAYNSLFKVDRFSPGTPPQFVGFQNYVELFQDRFVITSLTNTAFFVFFSVSIGFMLGFGVALLLYQPLRGRGVIRTLYLAPVMVAPIVAGLQWRWLYTDQYGVINYFLETLGIPGPLWLADADIAMWSIIIVDVWLTFPFVMLVLVAGLTSVPETLIESSRVDGANYVQRLRWIILPIMKPTILVVLLIRIMDAFRVFDTIYVLTRGGPGVSTETISTYTYRLAFSNFNFESAGALSLIATTILLILSLFLVRFLRSSDAL